MSNKKDAVKKVKASTSGTSLPSGAIRRTEKEKNTELQKVKKNENASSVKSGSVKQSSSSSGVKDADKKLDKSAPVTKKTTSTIKATTMKVNKTSSVDTPSKRVTRSQYFPTKNLYANALKDKTKTVAKENSVESPRTSQRSITKSKPDVSSKPLAVKKPRLKATNSTEVQKQSVNVAPEVGVERPGTATLRKASVANVNTVGPDMPKSKNSPDDYDYEDDFDSYESDFEEYESSSSRSSSSSVADVQSAQSFASSNSSSENDTIGSTQKHVTDEERKLDSGNYDLNLDVKHKQMLDNIKESVEQENAALSNFTSLSDEGFEEGKSPQNSAGSNGSGAFINFLDAQKKCIRRKSLAQRRKRGEELFNMIKLDNQYFTLLDIAAVSYEDYIKVYGNKSGHQVACQTGEDNVDEEIQTDVQEFSTKWTQLPIVISKKEIFDKDLFKMDLLGVGTELNNAKTMIDEEFQINSSSLSRFLNSVEDVMGQMLQANTNDVFQTREETKLPFSNGFVPITLNHLGFLANKTVSYVAFSSIDESKFLTVHSPQGNDNIDEEVQKSVVCIWDTVNVVRPEKVLVTFGRINCCCFGIENPRIIFGAFEDGTVAVWMLDEISALKYSDDECVLTKPNYITNVNYGHVAKVVSVDSLIENCTEIFTNVGIEMKRPSQICSLDETGILILWSVIVRGSERVNSTNVSLMQNSKIDLSQIYPSLKDLQCTSVTINMLDFNHLFISTNYGYILHYLANGTKPIPTKYVSEEISPSTCVSACPFSPVYFLSGQENGKITLYYRSIEKPVKELTVVDNEAGIKMLCWSYNRPFVFYSVDDTNNLHVWNLANSDMYPTHSIKFNEMIDFLCVSPSRHKELSSRSAFMVIVTNGNKINLHVLNEEHTRQPLPAFEAEMRRFFNYVNRF